MSTPYVGEIRMFGFNRLPQGWLPCDGSLQSIAQYEVLFNLIGNTYGGDGINTFGMPDLRGQVPLHQGNGQGLTPRFLGQAGGVESVTLNVQQIAQHGHALVATTNAATSASIPANGELGRVSGDTMYVTDTTGGNAALSSIASTYAAGGNQPHDNLMPTLTVQFCIACDGVYPTPA